MVEPLSMPDHHTQELEQRLHENMAEDALVKAIINERLKITSAMFNQMSMVFFTVGFATPLFTYMFSLALNDRSDPTAFDQQLILGYFTPPGWVALLFVICIIAWLSLHFMARWILRGLK